MSVTDPADTARTGPGGLLYAPAGGAAGKLFGYDATVSIAQGIGRRLSSLCG